MNQFKSQDEVKTNHSKINIFEKIRLFFNRNNSIPEDLDHEASKPDKEDTFFSELFNKEVPFEFSTELLLTPGLDEYIRVRGSDFRMMGIYDGIKGINDNKDIEQIADAHSTTLVQYIAASSKGKLEAYSGEMKVKERIMNDEEHRYCDIRQHLDDLTYYYHKYPRSFSFALSLFYYVIAFILIFADFPMAKSLTEQGFNLDTKSDWTIFLVVGIALCAVYIKIYYDDYIATPLGFYVSQFSRIPGIIGDRERSTIKNNGANENAKSTNGASDNNTFDENPALRHKLLISRWEYWIKFTVKTAILFLSLWTIWTLGEFRYQNIGLGERQNIDSYVDWAYNHGLGSRNAIWKDAFGVTLLAFRLITILFPIIGGVCLSLAMTNSQNCFRFWYAKLEYNFRQKRFLRAEEKYNSAKKKHHDFNGIWQEWHGDDNGKTNIEYFKKVFHSYYLIGQKAGYYIPDYFEPNLDIYEQTEKMRRRLVSRRVNNILGTK